MVEIKAPALANCWLAAKNHNWQARELWEKVMSVGNLKRADAVACMGFPWRYNAAGVTELAELVFEGVSHLQDAAQPFNDGKGEDVFFHATAK